MSRVIYYILLFFIFGIFMKYTLKFILPFAVGFMVSAVIAPIAEKISGLLHLPRRAVSFILLCLLLALLVQGIYFIANRLVLEAGRLLASLRDRGEIQSLVDRMVYVIEEQMNKLPFLHGADINGRELLSGAVNRLLSDIRSGLTRISGRVLSVTPYIILTPIVTVMSCFYFTLDHDKIISAADRICTKAWGERFSGFKTRIKKAARSYVRAYVSLFLLTFFELSVGFFILKAPYVLLLSLAVALVDILPVFGAGTVLLPWGGIMLALGNHKMGLGLIILYGVITIVRQIAEPHIVGESLGIHPLLSLIFMFVGFGLFGVVGMLLGPFVASLTGEMIKNGEDELYRKPSVNTDDLTCNK